MPNAYLLIKALPPTTGHRDLIEFAGNVAEEVHLILVTQPDEPMVKERYAALNDLFTTLGERFILHHVDTPVIQNPRSENDTDFWETWAAIVVGFGMKPDDYLISSEPSDVIFAEYLQAVFVPYDINRSVHYTKATNVRHDYRETWEWILPEFRHNLIKTVTIFGAESTGKTTLSRELARRMNGSWVFEWARPYLETVGGTLTVDQMNTIWHGQKALQDMVHNSVIHSVTLQDTDLFSTIGFWENWDMNSIPEQLYKDAINTRSDLYIITQSNIPFEEDVLRYGGDKRESTDDYWITLLERFGLPYIVLQSDTLEERVDEAIEAINTLYANNVLEYQR